jgi:hypothetical protein
MSLTKFLVENMTELIQAKSLMNGGKTNSMNVSSKQNNVLLTLLIYLVILLIKGLIVYLLYNFLLPKLIYSVSENKSLEVIESKFKTITYTEAILLVIFVNTLFGR